MGQTRRGACRRSRQIPCRTTSATHGVSNMTFDELLSRLNMVRRRGNRSSARCPAHEDRSPSLSVSEGERGILLKCWVGCTLQEICSALGIREADLFFDALDPDPHKRRAAAQDRERERQRRECHAEQQGSLIDALRAADYFVRSRSRLDISTWTDDRLNDELHALADGYSLLEKENLDGQLG